MRVPLSWLAEHVDLEPGARGADVAAALVRVGLEEEGVHTSGVTGPLVVGRVLDLTPEPQKNGKTINWCHVDVGPELNGPDGHRGIVCGAHNFTAGDAVVVALPGAVLPGDFAIAARRTYGHVSDGMICSAKELGLGADHSGIIVLEQHLPGVGVTPGQDALALLGLAEETVEVNVTPDRGYCFSVRGIAREYAHGVRRPTAEVFHDPVDVQVPAPSGPGYPVRLSDDAPIRGAAGCDRFVARVVRGVDPAAPTPRFIADRLRQAGMRPISLAVDVTNYLMLATGQPLHAYDLAALQGELVVRRARAGEQLTTLDGVERALDPEDLLITDEVPGDPSTSRVLSLAGVMGGASTEVSAATTDVLVEAAHFSQVTVARTARRHRLPTESAKRFERGVDPAIADRVVELAVRLLAEHGGGTADAAATDVGEPAQVVPLTLPAGFVERVVGTPVGADEVAGALREVGCEVTDAGGVLTVVPPTWRPDLAQRVDLVEEVARLRGYDAIPSVLPAAPAGRGLTPQQRARRSAARALADDGFVEVLSYPFVAAAVHDAQRLAADDPRRRALRLANPLSEQQPLMRTSVLDSLVDVVRRNVSRGLRDLALVEFGAVTLPVAGSAPAPLPGVEQRPGEGELTALLAAVPPQPLHVAGVLTGARRGPGAAADGFAREAEPVLWADAVDAARAVAAALGVEVVVEAVQHAPWHPGRCARVSTRAGHVVGHAGELHPAALEALELPARAAAFELDLDVLLAQVGASPQVGALSGYPAATQDVALVVDAAVPAARVEEALRAGAGELLEDVHLFDVYTGAQVGEGRKSLAYALRFRAPDRTLTAEEAGAARDAAVAEASRRTEAVQRA
ncbi:phenylalanine--tRNA ligase subunit beta [Paenibacillus sp. TRM 82003]|uniref:phenylalanine--tRNA ligase subunit beta n=1 Tax=Kineococcus sp. TRM81007 TaxID=2925831 RepID=UPI001F57BCE8|nr:phenylalanine--tRNA ligase subunit beta [Kineococcus sp. TRM81007]MCI2239751.1 phenylalanine--tRNA ligase subunit beta [Kineococcus sp. TRM81007]MCI3926687.1 phenylalanine--tRNA ligase subunit beta [Paenibacillus sp. TRM 82003]